MAIGSLSRYGSLLEVCTDMLEKSRLHKMSDLAAIHERNETEGNVPLDTKRNSARQDTQTVMATVWSKPQSLLIWEVVKEIPCSGRPRGHFSSCHTRNSGLLRDHDSRMTTMRILHCIPVRIQGQQRMEVPALNRR